MAEYIEREAVLDGVERRVKNPAIVRWLENIVEAVPTADVVPVVHGRWEHLEQGWIDLWRCSACGDEWTFEYDPTDSKTKVNYCPNCGAMMDGE